MKTEIDVSVNRTSRPIMAGWEMRLRDGTRGRCELVDTTNCRQVKILCEQLKIKPNLVITKATRLVKDQLAARLPNEIGTPPKGCHL